MSWDSLMGEEPCPLHGAPSEFDVDGARSSGTRCLPCWRFLAAWYWRLFPQWIGQNWKDTLARPGRRGIGPPPSPAAVEALQLKSGGCHDKGAPSNRAYKRS